jgi:hypothetical protein
MGRMIEAKEVENISRERCPGSLPSGNTQTTTEFSSSGVVSLA